jgi:hypothetical protein
MQEVEICGADVAPRFVGGAGILTVAVLPTSEKTGEPHPVPVKQLDNLV